jgi:large subunit ribosomal protein L16
MKQPKKVKYYKQHKNKLKGNCFEKSKLLLGKYGLQALQRGQLTAEQIEASRRIIKTTIKRFGNLWVRVSTTQPITRKSENSRMGSGKGNVKFWVSNVKSGRIIFEISDIPLDIVKKAFSLASTKLPIKTKIIIN